LRGPNPQEAAEMVFACGTPSLHTVWTSMGLDIPRVGMAVSPS